MTVTPHNMAKVVARYANVDATRVRPTYTVNANGLRSTTTVSTAIKVSMQPITGDDLRRLPESFHSKNLFSFWTVSELRDRDILVIGGDRYEVQHVENWNSAGLYWRALANQQLDAEEP